MGYYMSQVDADFFISKENFAEVVKAIHNLANYPEKMGGSSAGKPHYSWVGENFDKINGLEEIFNYWRWEVYLDDDGNVTDICFEGDKLGDDEVLFKAIAPYVKKGSFIQMNGEGTDQWRWVFNGVSCYEQHPRVIWD